MNDSIAPAGGAAVVGTTVRRRLLRGTPWSTLGFAVSTIGVLVTSGVLARMLTPSNLGAYYLALSVVTVAAIIARLGLSQLVVRLISAAIAEGRPGLARGVIRGVAIVGAASASVCGIAVAFGIGPLIARTLFQSSALAGVMVLAGAWLFAEALRSVFAESFRGFHEIAQATVFGDAFRTLATVVILGVVFAVAGVVALRWAVTMSLLASWLVLGVAAIALRMRATRLGPAEAFVPASLIRPGVTLMLVELAAILINQTDLWVVGALSSTPEVARYGAALRLGFIAAVPLLIVNGVLAPIIAELHVQGRKREMERTLRTTATLTAALSLLILLVLGLFGQQILHLLFGAYFEDAAVLLVVLAAGQTFGVVMGSCGLTLMMVGEGAALMRVSFIAVVGTVLLELVMESQFGVVGVAVASSLGLAAQNIGLVLVVRRKLGIWTPAYLSVPGLRQVLRSARSQG